MGSTQIGGTHYHEWHEQRIRFAQNRLDGRLTDVPRRRACWPAGNHA
jgi:hypothetical protein